ncbi:MAG: hypothetical protein U0169_19065 [Polyangiaceae bacterium]
MTSPTTILSVVQGFFTVVGLFLDLAIIVLALTRVRRNRPEAAAWLGLSGAAHLVALVVNVVGAFASRMVSASSGADAMIAVYAGLHGLVSTITLVGWVFLFVALLRLSDDPNATRGPP